MKKVLGIIAVGAIAFGAVSAAATSLTVSQNDLPAQGTDASIARCEADAAVSYTYDGTGDKVAAIVVTVDDATCASYDATISAASGKTLPAGSMGSYVADATPANGGTWTYDLTTDEAISTFDPGEITVTFK